MTENTFKIRFMKVNDFGAVTRIDEKVLNAAHSEYYKVKFSASVQSPSELPTSFVAEAEDGTVVGFLIGELFIGERGNIWEKAILDTIGVDPDYQNRGIGKQLIYEFIDHLRTLGVKSVSTLVDKDDPKLTQLLSTQQFSPSKTINLERII